MLFTTFLTPLAPVLANLGPLQGAVDTLPLPSGGEGGENPLDSVVNILTPSEGGEGGLPGLATQIADGIGEASAAVSGGITGGLEAIGGATEQVATLAFGGGGAENEGIVLQVINSLSELENDITISAGILGNALFDAVLGTLDVITEELSPEEGEGLLNPLEATALNAVTALANAFDFGLVGLINENRLDELTMRLPRLDDFEDAASILMELGNQYDSFAEDLQTTANNLFTALTQLETLQGVLDSLASEEPNPELPFGELPDLGSLEDVLSGSLPGLEGLNDILSLLNGFGQNQNEGTVTESEFNISDPDSAEDSTASGTLSSSGTWALSNGEESGQGNLGTFEIDEVGNWTYTLDQERADSLREGDEATETFQVTATDTSGNETSETVTITVVGKDELYLGTTGNDLLSGSRFNDRMLGDNGADVLFGDGGDDTLNGGDGSDALYGDDGDDMLNGGGGSDVLFGGRGDDIVEGGDGSDALYGGDGSDALYGGSGADTFSFEPGDSGITEAEIDQVLDFEDGIDSIDFANYNLGRDLVIQADGGALTTFADAVAAANNALYLSAPVEGFCDVIVVYNFKNTGDALVFSDDNSSGSINFGDTVVKVAGVNNGETLTSFDII